MANKYDINIEQGADWSISVIVDKDLSGYSAKCQIRKYAYSDTVVVEPTCTVNIVERTVTLELTAAQTALIPAGGADYSKVRTYVYDAIIYNTDGRVYRILNGLVNVSPGVCKHE